jgi:spermidine synthase
LDGIWLGLVLLLSGAALLGMELAASRVLAPAFGSSVEVWGALLAAVLLALAIGYSVGGRLADRWPDPLVLALTLTTSAVLVAVIPALDGPVLRVASRAGDDRAGALIAALLLFVLPAAFMAMSTPLAVRLCVRSLRVTGRTAGDLFAVSTVGSITGSLLTSFWLLPLLGVSQVMIAMAGTLGVAAVIAAAVGRRLVPALAIAGATGLVAVLVSIGAPSAEDRARDALSWAPAYRVGFSPDGRPPPLASGVRVLHAEESRYHQISVADEPGDLRVLRFGRLRQSAIVKDRPLEEPYPYAIWSHLPIAHAPRADRTLTLGLGGGSVPRRMLAAYPSMSVEVAELDPAVVDVARDWFGLPSDPRLQVRVADGRRDLQRHPGDLDVLAVDTFFADGVPFHLYTQEFARLAKERLAPGGSVLLNTHGSLTGSRSRLWRSIHRTYASVFRNVVVYPVSPDSPGDVQNVMLLATDAAIPSVEALQTRWAELRRSRPLAPDLSEAIASRWTRPVRTDDVPVLTDDYAPADSLLEI